MIQGWGSSKPGLIFIGDAPFGEDVKNNYALTGYTDRVLKELCAGAHLNAGDFYRTLLIKEPVKIEYVSKGNKKKVSPLDEVYEKFMPKYTEILAAEINELDPYLLVPLGELAFRWTTRLKGIRKFRGSILGSNNPLLKKVIKTLPVLGPYPYMNQDYKLKFISGLDFQKVPKYLNDSPPPENIHNLWICKSSSALHNFIERSYPIAKYLVFDIETFAGVPTCISFCFDGFESVCVPIVDYTIDAGVRMLMWDQVIKLLASPIPKINQNIKYDDKILERWGVKVNNIAGDTMFGMNIVFPEFPKNLGFITSIYTEIPYFKDEGKSFDPAAKNRYQLYMYNAKDSLAVHQAHGKMVEDMVQTKTIDVYNTLIKLMPIYKRMENTGLMIDETQRLNLQGKYESLLRIETLKIQQMISRRDFNPRSHVQCGNLIFEELGYEKIRGVKGTDEESLELLQTYGNPRRSGIYGPLILQSIINCRKLEKVLTIINLATYPDGRFRAEYNLVGTENGRTSGGQTTDELLVFVEKNGKVKVEQESLGWSLQTIGKHGFSINGISYGKDIRSMFVVDSDMVFAEVDLSQAEARVDAVLAKDFDILPVFDSSYGIHRLTGSWVYNCDPSEIKKEILVNGVDRYHMSKTVRHAGERNMKANRLVMMTQQPLKDCEEILDKFHSNQPNIRGVFHKEIKEAINRNRTLVAPNGRRRQFFDRIDDHMFNEAISYLPQAIVGDHMKFSLIPLLEKCPYALPVIEAHDGITSLVPKDRKEEYIEAFQAILDRPIDFRNCTLARDFELKIPSEAAISETNWQEMKEIKIEQRKPETRDSVPELVI